VSALGESSVDVTAYVVPAALGDKEKSIPGYGTIQSSMIDDLYARNVDGYIAPYCRLFLLQRL
jgi:hypothetical protein